MKYMEGKIILGKKNWIEIENGTLLQLAEFSWNKFQNNYQDSVRNPDILGGISIKLLLNN